MAELSVVTDIALMGRVREGDECAFAVLHDRYQRKVVNFFYGLSRNHHAANDLCQETFLRIWKIRRRYRATGSFPGYLFGIARMVWLEHQREERKTWRLGTAIPIEEETGLAVSMGMLPDVRAAQSEIEHRIFGALNELPEEQRMVFILRNIQGLSLEDIASILDCPVNTVRSRKILAITKLRHVLSKVFASVTEQVV